MTVRDFLFEILTEELPPKALRDLELALAAGVRAGIDQAGVAHGEVQSFATPRRLAVWVKRLADRQPDQNVRRRGPPVSASFDAQGQPTRAALAFAESCQTGVEALQKIDEGKGPALFFVGTKTGAETRELLPGIVEAALKVLPTPKRMRWGAGEAEFVRPVHGVLMLFGNELVPAKLLDTESGHSTVGHRFHVPKPLRIGSPSVYARVLQSRGFVIADFTARRELIREKVRAVAAEIGGQPVMNDALLDEVTALVEWPVPIAARFDERFLALPREVLICTLQAHQRYFPIEDSSGSLTQWFIAVSNIESREPAKVREGNERVVRPRLADAAFFWDQDRKRPLASLRSALDGVTFQTKLGSVGDKVGRIQVLAGEIAVAAGADRSLAERAAELCKCDLLTSMVGEFPELQGVMGGYYAAADGEPAQVATAIREHYLPRGAGDEVASTPAGIAVAIADKLDTLAGVFAIGQKPSGTKDPFGLRRAALGIVRTLIERKLDLDLLSSIERAIALQPVQSTGVAAELYDYIMERLRAYYLESTDTAAPANRARVTTEMFDAVLATRPRSPFDFDARLRALSAFLELPEAQSLASANKRTANILRKANEAPPTEVDVQALSEPAEVKLFDAMRALQDTVASSIERREYAAALGQLAQLRPVVDSFFDQIMVMDEDAKRRANRLALLAKLRALFGGIADLSRLPG